MLESFKLQVKSKRSDLMRQALSRTGFDLRKALLWSVIILVLTGSGIGIAYWMGQRKANPSPASPPEAKPQPASGNNAVPPEPVVKEEEPSVAAPYFTEKMNKEISNFRVEGEKAALEQQQLKNLSDNIAQELNRKQKGNTPSGNMDERIVGRKELTRMAVEEKIADPATAREYALENEIRYSVRPLLDEPPQPQEPPPAPYPPIPQEPSFIEEVWRNIVDSLKDIARYFL